MKYLRAKKNNNNNKQTIILIHVYFFILLLYCIVFVHFYSASHSMSLSEALPTTAIDTVLDIPKRYKQMLVKDLPKVAT